MHLGIAIPTYNEAENIARLIEAIDSVTKDLDGCKCKVLVIDDASPDGTAQVAKSVKCSLTVDVLERRAKAGLGYAYIDGLSKLLAEGDCEFILQMDADFSHDPTTIPAFIQASKNSDFVVGSRYVDGGQTLNWSWYRKLLSRGGNLYTRVFLGSKIHDYTGGFNMFRSDVLATCDVQSIQSKGYGFLVELKYRALCCASQVTEVPITFLDRTAGVSKIPRSTILRNLVVAPRLRLSAWHKNRQSPSSRA